MPIGDLDKLLDLCTIFLPPVVVAAIAALTHRSPRRTLLTLALVELVTFIVGVALYDVVTGVRSASFFVYDHGNAHLYQLSSLFLATTQWLLIAALAFALWECASGRQWRWFAGLGITLLIVVGVFAAFSGGLASTDLFGGILSLGGFGGPANATHAYTSGAIRAFYIVIETLMLLVTLPSLLYALWAPRASSREGEAPSLTTL
ncbi:MAG: hypothetical protein ACRDHE_00590, partial [Ktedonobacterales bacterium]